MPVWALYTLGGAIGLWTLSSVEKGVEKSVENNTSRILIAALIVAGVYLMTKGGK